jgi:hypothetical protein
MEDSNLGSLDSICGRSVWYVSFCVFSKVHLTNSNILNSANDEDEDEEDDDNKKNKVANMISTHEKFGWPVIPDRGDKTLDELKAVIRAYVTAAYRECSPMM